MIASIWSGFISALQMLLISGGIFVAWLVGYVLKERSRDLQKTYRHAILLLVAVVAGLSILAGTGNIAKAFVYYAIVLGTPLALGLGPTDALWKWIAQETEHPQ